MRGTVHLVALILACLTAACAQTVDVAFEERDYLSRSHTWGWRPDAVSIVEAAPGEAVGLHVRLARLIDRTLHERGFERVRHDADFFVTYHLELRQQIEIATVPFAPYRLDSLHASPSYVIQGSKTERLLRQNIRLSIDVTESSGRIVWQASLERRGEGHSAPQLKDAVAALLETFPRSVSRAE
jgi:hypothetical protein